MTALDIGYYMIPIEEKAIADEDDCWTFTGYAAVFGNRDLGGDVIMPGAFRKSLDEHGLPDLHLQHRMDEDPIGTITDAYEDAKGLRVEGVLPKDSPRAREVYALLKPRGKKAARALRGMSIGYYALKSHRDKFDGKDTRFLTDVWAKEASFVKDPMNRRATVDTLKMARSEIGVATWNEFSDREREVHLKSLGLSDELAKRIVSRDRDGRGAKGQREAAVTAGDVSGLDLGLDDLSRHLRDTLNRF